jgi:quercetin dioxygenase-like cupin family protein
MEKTKRPPITIGNQDGICVSVVGDSYRILVQGKETGNDFAAIDMLIPPGGGPGPHAHAGFQETFYVVEGEIEVRSEAGVYVARKGAYVVIPKGGIVHQFKNTSTHMAHLLCIVVPSGLEQMFIEIGQPVAPDVFLPPPEMTPEVAVKMKNVAEKYGSVIYAPDYLSHLKP